MQYGCLEITEVGILEPERRRYSILQLFPFLGLIMSMAAVSVIPQETFCFTQTDIRFGIISTRKFLNTNIGGHGLIT